MSKTIAVIGLGFGDEGKGMVTSHLCSISRTPLVIRFSGGHQAGHTVVEGDITHTFANFGCGTLQGVPTYWSSNCTVDPVGLLNELKVLVDKMGDEIHETRLYINKDCPVTTPYDIKWNQEEVSDGIKFGDGTCGVGFGATHEREEDHFHLHFRDLFNPTVLKIKLRMIANYYGLPDLDISNFMEAVDILNDHRKVPSDVIIPVDRMPRRFETYIYEGSQGLLLDQEIGFFPHVTRSNVGAGRLSHGVMIDEVYYVTRAYQTRHGNGPMTNEDRDLKIAKIYTEANKKNDWQGEFRKTILDLDLLKYALEQDRKVFLNPPRQKLVITCMDQLNAYQSTCKGELSTSISVNQFVRRIVDVLKFDDNVYLSWSVSAELNEWKEEE